MNATEVFRAAAAGSAVDQEAMARASIADTGVLATASVLAAWTAYLWCNMALANGQLSIRPFRAQILDNLADRMVDDEHAAKDFRTDALATLYELAAEDHPGVGASITAYEAALSNSYGTTERTQIIEMAKSMASRRMTARLAEPLPPAPCVVTLH